MTQWIKETLVKYKKLEAAKLSMQKVLYHNTEPTSTQSPHLKTCVSRLAARSGVSSGCTKVSIG